MKIYTIIGGVNGCGKSSLTGSIKAERTDLGIIVDPDKITAELRGDEYEGGKVAVEKLERDTSPTAPRFPPPCGAFRRTGGKLYSRTPERRTAPRWGLSARAGTPRGGFCNTTRAGISGHDNARAARTPKPYKT
ncbi:MAG TPA: hypothetical protein H9860_09855 [Candidatus Gemmiger faecavium]|nr:hypothetical protein [Candidatus Gemmiger faecavium]